MRIRIGRAMLALTLVGWTGVVFAQSHKGQSTARERRGVTPILGIWTNSTTTPLERPAALRGREF